MSARPKGSRDAVTEAFRKYFLSLHRHPALALAEIASVPLEDLARRLGCSSDEATKLRGQAQAAIVAATPPADAQLTPDEVADVRRMLASWRALREVSVPGTGLKLVIGDLSRAKRDEDPDDPEGGAAPVSPAPEPPSPAGPSRSTAT